MSTRFKNEPPVEHRSREENNQLDTNSKAFLSASDMSKESPNNVEGTIIIQKRILVNLGIIEWKLTELERFLIKKRIKPLGRQKCMLSLDCTGCKKEKNE
ncbi:type-2 angiotensin II receptor isoform X2 [Microcaecilia unicolor]|uniref:Type-2 angiotensin II receptor isoform X2 n=1 Tax=Microcaecilia unicolor TaxID=1415580 RepID=A0A6P7YF14_9AMPH|nr:type-2 angiotensin II receptor isoform X2 [Microcaecilia unicolor]